MIRRILFLALGLGLLYGAFTLLTDEDAQTQPATASLSVTVVSPQQGSISQTISATGMTIPREELQVMTELASVRVREVLVDVGDNVKKGQILAVLDGQSQQHQVAQLKSDFERAHDAFARVDGIKDTGAVSKQLVTEKRTAMQSAKALLEDAELNLKRSTITAPEAGVVFERKTTIGGLVSNSEPLFRIARRNEIEMEAMVPESALSALKVGQPVVVTLTGDSEAIEGKIRLVTPRVSDSTRMAAIRIQLKSTNHIPVGLFAAARIMQNERAGLLLPKTALQQDSTGDFVWTLTPENKAERLPVTVTLHGDEQVMVDGVALDARVVARAGAFIKDGDHVNAVEAK
ncbi:MAG: efflux RND transporter periplasmic adaptor subunit [Rickettsiales bacterium]|jgi:RND family efflux transporter MFP subunit|nr:efflux RND transporter periplasmic adaptor subunit [Rickettsiales bacterium]